MPPNQPPQSEQQNQHAPGADRHPSQVIERFITHIPETRRLIVGYSGGLDSHVLLHAMVSACRARPDIALSAVHINHNLQSASSNWANHCRNVCRDLGVPLQVLEAEVDQQSGKGLEAAARAARYSLFASVMQESDYLLLAQHADDQAETFLLQALRGSGPDGLASIPRTRAFADGWLCRPLLCCDRVDLESYAEQQELRWIEDPSNTNSAFDRNFLRNEIIPLLKQRWPALSQTLSRSASRSGAASRLLLSLAADDLAVVSTPAVTVGVDGPTVAGEGSHGVSSAHPLLEVSLLLSLGQERMFNVIRLWIRQAGHTLPRLQDLRQIEQDLLRNNREGSGLVNLRQCQVRRYQEQLWLLPAVEKATASASSDETDEGFEYHWKPPYSPLHIPEIDRTLTAEECAELGLDLSAGETLTVVNRKGGELIRVGNPEFHKAVKKLLQESRIPPWERERVPLLYVDGKLAAVWKVAVANAFRIDTTTC